MPAGHTHCSSHSEEASPGVEADLAHAPQQVGEVLGLKLAQPVALEAVLQEAEA